MLRLLELIFFFYFLTHIPITVLFDSQVIADDLGIPKELYPEEGSMNCRVKQFFAVLLGLVLNLTKQYVAVYKDPYLMDPPNWYKVFVFCELGLQLPFFFVATIAFMLGSKSWIRIPTLIYSSHVATTVAPMLYSFYFDDFKKVNRVGPETEEERMNLMMFYIPYFVIPVLMMLTMVFSKTYRYGPVAAAAPQKSQSHSQKKKKQH